MENKDGIPNVAPVTDSSNGDGTGDADRRAKIKAHFTSQGFWTGNIDFPTPEVVESFANDHSYDITRYWLILRAILYQHEDTIRKRWLKKSREGREAILVQAFPGISKQHNPSLCQHLLRRFSQEATLFPHLNLEDLGQPIPLLLFISARSRTHPKALVAHDSGMLIFRNELHGLNRMYLHGYKMHFNDDVHQVYATIKPDSPKSKHQHANRAFDMMPDGDIAALVVQKHSQFSGKSMPANTAQVDDIAFEGTPIPILELPDSPPHQSKLDHTR